MLHYYLLNNILDIQFVVQDTCFAVFYFYFAFMLSVPKFCQKKGESGLAGGQKERKKLAIHF